MTRCTRTPRRRSTAHPGTRAVLAAAILATTPAWATDFDTGNPDFKLRWDNTVRYNAAVRLRHRDPLVDRAGGFSYDQSNALFDRGDMITNRLDLLSELDLSFRERYGARLSGAAWYDEAYGSRAAHTANPSAYVNDEFTPVVKRFYAGPSGEILDAYLYGRFDLGESSLDARIGKHAVIWGEGLFGSTNSVAYSQNANDARKATANPGASAKETALPVSQVSAVLQVSEKLNLAFQYTFKWAPNRIPEGGTYFAGADTILDGPNVGRAPALEGRGGDVGLALRWRPDWLEDATVGFYARRFDEKSAWTSQLDPAIGLRRPVYARDVDLFGISLAKVLGGMSVGTEVSYRRHMPLNSRGAAPVTLEGARGETLHALVNAVATYGDSPVFASASLSGELAFTHLIKVTDNPALYRGPGNVAAGCPDEDIVAGCASRNFVSASVSFIPVWTQVFPSVDLSMPLFYSANVKGNAPTNGGGSFGFQTLKVGVSAVAYSRHLIDLAVTGYHGKTDAGRGLILGAPYNDKAYVSLTYQTTF
jgi:hypothetical protein